VYLAFILVALVNVILFRTRWGLRIRSVGEKPKASETVGLNVARIRFITVVLGGAIAGIGGATFTIGLGSPMIVGITGGQGFIALAIMIFGRWRPWGAFMATLLFGFSIALGSQYGLYTSQFGVPNQLITALPYLITIAAVAGLVGRVRPPAADGIPYSRE
jgi:simple sugar transport system permease protein